MKVFKILCLLLIFASCASVQTPPPPLDLDTKGVFRANLYVIDFDTMKALKPTKLFFVELSSKTEYKSERIIASDRVDADGMIYVNLTPGLYAIVASERYSEGYLVYTLFNEDLISHMVVQIEKGKTQTVSLRALDYSDTIFDKTPLITRYYRKIVCRNQGEFVRMALGKFYDSPEQKQKLEMEKKAAEKIGAKIETY